VYLYFTALGRQQDFGHGSAGAVILTAMIALFTIVQARLVGFGRTGSYG
jgi:multiple sugar transport system permease protein